MTRLPAARLRAIPRIRGAVCLGSGGGAAIARLPWFGWLKGALLLSATQLFLGHAVQRLMPAMHVLLPGITTTPPPGCASLQA
jgi:hypothetical protein